MGALEKALKVEVLIPYGAIEMRRKNRIYWHSRVVLIPYGAIEIQPFSKSIDKQDLVLIPYGAIEIK